MSDITNDLMYEVLKQLQTGQAEIKTILADHTRQLLPIREEINSLRGDDLRHESLYASMDSRLERIVRRLDLNDAIRLLQ